MIVSGTSDRVEVGSVAAALVSLPFATGTIDLGDRRPNSVPSNHEARPPAPAPPRTIAADNA